VNVTPDPATNALLSAQLNAGVARFEAHHAALNFYTHNYTPTGSIGIPVLTMHTTRDPGIPFAHEIIFADLVALAGQSDLLVQRPVNRWGHCGFTTAEILQAFGDLAQWVESGIKP
jgi:hypothetical protein